MHLCSREGLRYALFFRLRRLCALASSLLRVLRLKRLKYMHMIKVLHTLSFSELCLPRQPSSSHRVPLR